MKRNETVNAGALVVGDRFYKSGDGSKRVFEVLELQRKGIVAVEPNLKDSKFLYMFKRNFSAWIQVVFLRHKEEVSI